MDNFTPPVRRRKRRTSRIFPLFLVLYSCIALVAMFFGIQYLHGYLQNYERSLPYNTTDAYMQSLSADHICDKASSLLSQIDSAVQTDAEAISEMKAALTDPFTCTKSIKLSTDNKLVYHVRCGSQIVGSFEMEQTPVNEQGFSTWAITKETYDLSYLLKDGFSFTVPHNATVTANGKTLSDKSITVSGILYKELEVFYRDHPEYQLPTLTTYQIGKHLGEISLDIRDFQNNPLDPEADHVTFLGNCTSNEHDEIDVITENFITSYIHFTSQTNNDLEGNLAKLCNYIVPKGALEQRMRDAMRGLSWVTDRKVSIKSIETNYCLNVGNGRYLCNITYVVDTNDISGQIQSVCEVMVAYVMTDDGLKAESMLNY